MIHRFPSQLAPALFTSPGIFWVFSSWILWRMPSFVRLAKPYAGICEQQTLERNPTMIFGTPSRKDWIQNLLSFRSNFTLSASEKISWLVFSSTQLMGSSGLSGRQSHTKSHTVSFLIRASFFFRRSYQRRCSEPAPRTSNSWRSGINPF